jgi:hypothetical protein
MALQEPLQQLAYVLQEVKAIGHLTCLRCALADTFNVVVRPIARNHFYLRVRL